ncbi:Sodium/hydrogen exchanger family-domain-containing protein [Kickxella alabastrina]|uniref:Sodium/hydrogen exchanger family-domain-containing protein n=1 Tax=Kickxella alabastrina TaxID=61397 RepID=UPI002220D21A|nr:Sodium/hydrogen exchanger family-domain-containing protein [Kickxella alabastrina]KAI7826262.1 Sodium/hydrogen exchanger family-domain-containing protein [Kickxella alabastrina]
MSGLGSSHNRVSTSAFNHKRGPPLSRVFAVDVHDVDSDKFQDSQNAGPMEAQSANEFPDRIPFSESAWSVAIGILSVGGLIGALISGAIATESGDATRCGVASGVATIYVGEIAPIRWRGFYGTFFQLALVLGILIAQLVAMYVTTGLQWRIVVALPGVLSVVQIALLPLHVESPIYLIKARHVNEARHALLKLRRGFDVSTEWQEGLASLDSGEADTYSISVVARESPVQSEPQLANAAQNDSNATMKYIAAQTQQLAKISPSGSASNPDNSSPTVSTLAAPEARFIPPISIWHIVCGRTRDDLRHLVACSSVLMALQQMAGIATILFGGNEMANAVFYPEFPLSAPWTCILICLTALPAIFLCILLVDKLGRRPLLLGSLGGMAICSILAAIGMIFNIGALIIAGVFVCYFMFNFGLGTIPWFFVSESVPAYALGATTVLGCSLNWVLATILAPSIISGRNPIAYSASNPIVLFIVQLLIIISVCRFLHLFLKRLNQPTVISEIIGGILLGPTVLGRWKAFTANVFPSESLVNLNLMANFGLIMFLFIIGLELDPRILKRNIRRSIMISVAGMALPFALGVATSYALYHVLLNNEGRFHIFMLFLGVAMAITAFPVLARILTELNLLKTIVGHRRRRLMVHAGLVIALTNNSTGLTALWVLLVGAGWTLFIVFAVRPAYLWYLRRVGCLRGREPSQFVLFLTFVLVLVSAFFTDAIGIHAIFGAFIVGAIVPHDGGFAVKVTEKIEDVTNMSSLDDGKTWGLLILVCSVAFIGKTGGCSVAARLSGFSWREALTIGVLMDCKGLVELIVLNIGLQAGVIDTRIFSMMVVMALVTTIITAPLVAWLYPPHRQTRRRGPQADSPMHVLVVFSQLAQVPAIMTLLGHLHRHQKNQQQSHRPLRVFGLRLLELTGRDSSIMQQYESELLAANDPVLSTFRAFARIVQMPFDASLAYRDRERFVDCVLENARDAGAEMTVVSAFGRNSSTKGGPPAVVPGWFEGMGWGFTAEQQAEFIAALFARAQGTVGVFIDCSGTDGAEGAGRADGAGRASASASTTGAAPMREEPLVVVPFFGGADDRQALRLASDLCTHAGVRLLVWRFGGPVPARPAPAFVRSSRSDLLLNRAATRVDDEGGAALKDEAEERSKDAAFLAATLDPRAAASRRWTRLDQALGVVPTAHSASAEPPGGGLRLRPLSQAKDAGPSPSAEAAAGGGPRATRFPNATIETIVTGTPLQTLLLRARQLSSADLIVCGRSVRGGLAYHNNEQELLERQRALGTVTEYLLGFGADAGILVVQGWQEAPSTKA